MAAAKPQADTSRPGSSTSLRSKRFYWGFGIIAGAIALFVLYYSFYVSSQQTYYNERAFRLLSVMGDSVTGRVERVRDVLAASAVHGDQAGADEYVRKVMSGLVGESDFTYDKLINPGNPDAARDGALSLFFPVRPNSLRLPLEYRKSNSGLAGVGDAPCPEKSPVVPSTILACATLNFEPLLRPTLLELDENFFDDVLIADSEGEVLYQQFPAEVRIKNLSSVIFPQGSKSEVAASKKDPSLLGDVANKLFPGPVPASPLSALSRASHVQTIDLAGSSYKMYVQPLPLLLRGQGQQRSLIVCGLRSLKKTQSEALALPYTYLIWGILLTLAFFALSWPLLKLIYMSPKERLQSRHILYLIFSVLFGTVLLTLIALNTSYHLSSIETSTADLVKLSGKIQENVATELRDGLATLDAMAADPGLLKYGGSGQWNQADFFSKQREDFEDLYRQSTAARGAHPYPFFRYFFLADAQGDQRLKYSVNSYITPKTNISREDYFRDVMDEIVHEDPNKTHQESIFDEALASLPPTADGCEHPYRVQPLFSPNTGEFLVAIATPSCATGDPGLKPFNVTVKVLVVKMESLVNPVLPAGYGYAIVDSQGNVQFHSISTRNLLENFSKESRANAAVAALQMQRRSDAVQAMYLGTQKLLWVTPIDALGSPPLTLIVFRDSAYFTTLNVAVFMVFGLLISFYAGFFVIAVVLRLLWQHRYPLEIIWPDHSRMRQYLRVLVMHCFLAWAFFAGYVSFEPERVFISVFLVIAVSVVYCILQDRSHLFTRLANLLAFGVMASLVRWDVQILIPVGFAVAMSLPTLAILERRLAHRLQLKYVYTLLTVSTFVVFAVVPSCGFFKVSYDYVQRLFLQRQQLDLTAQLRVRRHRVHEFYMRRQAPWLVGKRWDSDLDRYDRALLNFGQPAANADCLQASRLEMALAQLTARLPSNDLGAQLRELAAGLPPAGESWSLLPSGDGQSTLLSLAPGPCGTGAPTSLQRADQIVSPYPRWQALGWRGCGFLLVAILAIALWIHFVTCRIFLSNLHPAAPLENWDPRNDDAKRLLILGHPKSGKSLSAGDVPDNQIVDLAEMAMTGHWEIPRPMNRVIILDHFEFCISDASISEKKLALLEGLTYVDHQHVIILSSIDPLYYLTRSSLDLVTTEKDDLARATQILDRWAVVLTPFAKREIEDVNRDGLLKVLQRTCTRKTGDATLLRFADWVKSECDHTAQLRRFGKMIVHAYRDRSYSDLSFDGLLEELCDRADAYYHALWATCTPDERLVLFQLTEDGWANPKNDRAIQQLERRGLVIRAPGLRIMNESFRRFIHISRREEEVATWKQEGEQSVWRSLKLVLFLVGGLMLAWLLYAQQQILNAAVGYVSAIGAATGIVIKLLGDLRGKASSGGSDARS